MLGIPTVHIWDLPNNSAWRSRPETGCNGSFSEMAHIPFWRLRVRASNSTVKAVRSFNEPTIEKVGVGDSEVNTVSHMMIRVHFSFRSPV